MVTWAGWLFHYSDGTPLPDDTDPAFQGTIEFRPNEAAEQFVPDQLPADDSQLFAPPPLEQNPNATTAEGEGAPAAAAAAERPLAAAGAAADRHLHRHPQGEGRSCSPRRAGAPSPARRAGPSPPAATHLDLQLSRERYPTRLAFQISEVKGK